MNINRVWVAEIQFPYEGGHCLGKTVYTTQNKAKAACQKDLNDYMNNDMYQLTWTEPTKHYQHSNGEHPDVYHYYTVMEHDIE